MQTETQRLVLRRFKTEDLKDFYEYARVPDIGLNAGFHPHESIEESKVILDIFIESEGELALELKENGKCIGSVGFRPDKLRRFDGAYNIGYSLSKDYWGWGLMTEAVTAVLKYLFEDLEAFSVSVGHFDGNERSKRVIEKCGFVYEGKLRSSYITADGVVKDENVYSILRDEYQRINNAEL
ncbi:MAG: GNAT family protein [Clostridia bacterium]|nr:GNAT family protein [Clostridia bacterium]